MKSKGLTVFLSLVLAIATLYFARGFLMPVTMALFLWCLVYSLKSKIKVLLPFSKKLKNLIGNFLAISIIVSINFTIIEIFSSQAEEINEKLDNYIQNASTLTESLTSWLGEGTKLKLYELAENIELSGMLQWLGASAGSLVGSFILVLMYTCFLVAEEGKISIKAQALFKDREKSENIYSLMTDIVSSIQQYIWRKSVVSIFTALGSYAVLELNSVDFAAILAISVFFLNFIPNIGSILGAILPTLVATLQSADFSEALVILVYLGSIQFLIGNVVEPIYMGKTLNLSSFMIILSLTFWGTLWGITGMLLAVPMMVVLGIVCSRIESLHWVSILLSDNGKPVLLRTGI